MKTELNELARLFFKLGSLSFGGPAAHTALMHEEVVRKRKWMDEQHFLDLVGATNLIPGPNSTELAIHCGHERAGVAGLFVAGAAFILPACLISGALAVFYGRYGALPQVEPFFFGIKPAVLAVIFGAVWALGKKAVKNGRLAVLGAVALLGAASGLPAAGVIIGLGVLGMIWQTAAGRSRRDSLPAVEPFSLGLLFAVFLKIGAILFGSGLVLVAYLQSELVDGLGWLTRAQLLDAIAIGQFTPGPVLSTATFIGYQVGGPAGALVATLGIFLPSFFFVWALNPLIPRMRQSRWMAGFLDAVNVVSIGVMAGTAGAMGWQVLDDWRGVVIAVASGVLALGPKKISTVWILAGGALLGRILWLF